MIERDNIKRRPVANFIIKPRLQLKLIILFVFASVIASVCSLGLLFLILRIDLDGLEGLRTAWYYLKATYPGFGIAAAVSLLVGILVGTYASRKVALPIYKVEKWSKSLQEGNLKAKLGMRNQDYWEEMAKNCNTFTHDLRKNFKMLQSNKSLSESELREKLNLFLNRYHF